MVVDEGGVEERRGRQAEPRRARCRNAGMSRAETRQLPTNILGERSADCSCKYSAMGPPCV